MHIDLRNLPPLDTLKGFEAAARHLSFTKAAAELFLTQSAISRQIASLEDHLGVKLFRRETRRLALTPEGETLQREVTGLLARLAEVCAILRAGRQRPRVTVSGAVSVVALWLLPRLSSFLELEPNVDVRLSADNRMVDLDREDIDLALRNTTVDAVPPDTPLLFSEVVFPVASPALAATLPAVLTSEEFSRLTLLAFEDYHLNVPWLSWEPWLISMGLAKATPKAVLQFNHYDQMIRAAEDGRGIALGRGALVAEAMAAGRLQALGSARERIAARGYFLMRSKRPPRPEVERFAAWLMEEARKTELEVGD